MVLQMIRVDLGVMQINENSTLVNFDNFDDVTVTFIGTGRDYPISNPERGWLHFT